MAADGSPGDSEHVGDLRVGQLLVVTQDEYGPLLAGQAFERLPEPLLLLGGQHVQPQSSGSAQPSRSRRRSRQTLMCNRP